jgi:formate dehydrogenase maturation protein FdhE
MMNTVALSSHWYTGEVIRMCACGTDGPVVSPCLNVYTDGRRKYAHCDCCGKTWDAETLREIKQDGKHKVC